MKYYSQHAEDFVDVLEVLPDGIGHFKNHLRAKYGIHIPVNIDSAWHVWQALVSAKGKDRMADIVAEYIISDTTPRIRDVIKMRVNGLQDLPIKADDSDLLHVLFDHDDRWDELGEFVADYYDRSRIDESSPGEYETWDRSQQPKETLGVAEFKKELDALRQEVQKASKNLDSQFTGSVQGYYRSAELNRGLGFQRVQLPTKKFLIANPTWLEADLEKFIIDNWDNIDFGVGEPLILFDRQARISPNSRDMVDLLAKSESGNWFAIELKIVEARARAFSQLASYVSQLIQEGVPSNKARGLLIAPSFSPKVVNSAAIQPNIELLQFQKP